MAISELFETYRLKSDLKPHEKYSLFISSLDLVLSDIDLEGNFIPTLKRMEVQDFHTILKSDVQKTRFYLYLWIKGVRL